MRFFEDSWELYSFGDLFNVANGINKEKESFGVGCPIVNYMDVNKHAFLKKDMILGLVNSTQTEQGTYSILPNDLIVTRTSETIDEIAYSSCLLEEIPHCVFSGFLLRARPLTNKTHTIFMVYELRSETYRKVLKKYSTETSRALINSENLKKVPLCIPSLENQQKIANFLVLIDERIETQSKIIEDIETLRKWIINQQFTRTATNAIREFIEQTSERNKTNSVNRVLSVSNKYGFINQSEQFEDREVASDDRTNYKIVRRNDFAFNPARINVGSIAKLDTYDIGIVSPMYICFKSNNKNLDADYLSNFFSSNSFKNALNKRLEGSVRQCLQFDALCDIKLFVPSLNEQISFVSKIKAITKKLTIEKDILSAYKKQKAYLLSNMFI